MKRNILKSLFISLILVMGVSNAWGAYYYRGNQNAWGATQMTASEDGFYEYFAAKSYANNGNQNQMFKVSTSASSWNYNNTYMKSGFNGTNITNMGSWDSDNICMYHDKDYYILVYKPNTTVNNTTKPIVCAATYLPDNRECTVYFVNKDSWSSVNAYGWYYQKSTDGPNNVWPGKAMENTGKTYNGKQIWSYTYPQTYDKAIFNNGSSKTSDLTLGTTNKGKMYDYPNSQWIAYTYDVKVTFNANGHGTAPTAKTVLKGAQVSAPTAPTATGYTFGGWYKDADCTNAFDFNTAITANITLYAKWTADQYDITYKDQGGSTFSGAHEDGYPTKHTYGTETTLKTASKDEYTFDGWFTNPNCIDSAITSLGATAYNTDITLYAKWTSNAETKYNVTAKANPVEGGNVIPTTATLMGVTSGGNITAIPNEGYAFTSWSIISGNGYFGATGSNNTSEIANTIFRPTQESTIEASFIEIKHTINILSKDENQGTVTPESTTAGVVTASTDNITAIPKEGYEFVEWTASSGITLSSTTDASTKVTKATTDGTVTAIFREKKYTINLKANNAEYGSIAPITITVGQHNASETITANPNIGYRFVNWTATDGIIIANANNASTTITAKQAGTVTANFEALPPVTIYFKPTSAWKNHYAWFAVYYWENKDGGNKEEGWLTLEDGDGHGNLYTAEIPGGYNNLIFVRLRPSTADGYTSENSGLNWNNQWEQTEDLTTPTDDKVLYDMESKNAATHLYLKPNGNWKSDGARFAAYFFGNGEEWVDMEKVNDDLYFCDIPTTKSYPSVILCRMNPENANNNWNNKWNQTGDLTIPTDGKNLFTLNDGVWDGATETWSTIYDNSKWAIYDPEENEEEQVVYLKPTGYWSNDNPTFVAHIWNNSSNEDIPMTAIGSGYYACTIPIGYHSVVFYRKSTDGKTIWNQTSDLTIPAHRANCYTIKSTGEGTTKKATGKWNELMLRRRHHNATQQVYDTTGIDIVNSTITFHKDIITNSELSVYERSLYWISFPFDITLNNAFGFGNYGEHWIIEYYDGAERAEKGLWSDASYWKYITDPNYTLKAGVGYVLCLDIDAIIRDDFFNTTDNISLYFPSNNVNLITQITVPEHICDVQRPTEDRSEEDSNWNIIGVPSYTDIANLKNGTSFYYQWNATDNTYTTQDASASTFQVMHAYMVQFAGTIDWAEASVPAQIAARRNTASKDQYTLRLALQQEQQEIDHTFIRLQAEDATSNFDLNTDLTKIINNKTSLYSLIDDTHEAAANVLPMQAATIPLGIEVATDGDYTLSMPDGTDGISAILLDYQMGTQTNMLLSEYKITLEAGIYTNRFALIVDPQQTATEIGHPHINSSDDVHKYIINGQLFIQSGGNTYDIQGRRVK